MNTSSNEARKFIDEESQGVFRLNEIHKEIASERANELLEDAKNQIGELSSPVAQALLVCCHATLSQREYEGFGTARPSTENVPVSPNHRDYSLLMKMLVHEYPREVSQAEYKERQALIARLTGL